MLHLSLQELLCLDELAWCRECHAWTGYRSIEAQAHPAVGYGCDVRKATGQVRVLLARGFVFHATELMLLVFEIVLTVATDLAFAVGTRFVDAAVSVERARSVR